MRGCARIQGICTCWVFWKFWARPFLRGNPHCKIRTVLSPLRQLRGMPQAQGAICEGRRHTSLGMKTHSSVIHHNSPQNIWHLNGPRVDHGSFQVPFCSFKRVFLYNTVSGITSTKMLSLFRGPPQTGALVSGNPCLLGKKVTRWLGWFTKLESRSSLGRA